MKSFHTFLLFILVYAVAGTLGLVFSPSTSYATLIAPVAGVALAGILLFGYRFWPGVWLGSSVLHFFIVSDWFPLLGVFEEMVLAGGIGLGATVQAVGGAYLIRRYVGFPSRLLTGRDVSLFLLLGGPTSCLVHASVGVVALLVWGVLTWESALFNWLIWWVGEAMGVLVILPVVSLAQDGQVDTKRHRLLAVGIPLGLIYILTIIAFLTMGQWDKERLRGAFEDKAFSVSESFHNNLDRYIDLIESQRSFFTTLPEADREAFRQYVHDSLLSHPGIQALAWIPRVEDGLRQDYERSAREDGFPNFQIIEEDANKAFVSASSRSEYFPIFFVEPYKGNESAFGLDLASNPVHLKALQQARDTGNLVLSAPIVLAQEPQPQPAVFMISPVYANHRADETVKDRRENLQGFALIVLRISDIVSALPPHVDQTGLEWVLVDQEVSGEKGHLYASSIQNVGEVALNAALPQHMMFRWDTTSTVGRRTWRFKFSQSSQYFFTHPPWDLVAMSGGGLLVCGFLGGFLLVLTGRKSAVEAQVKQQSHELLKNETRFRLVFDLSPSGMIMIDHQGIMILVNRNAEALFGYETNTLIGQRIECLVPERFRSQHSFNRESFLAHPTVRAMGSNQKLYGVRKNGSEFPVEIGLNPLTTEEEAFVLASVVDITARKQEEETLYRYMDDLHHSNQDLNDFAYIASHDLKEPLRGIHNYSQILLEDYGPQLDEEARAKCVALTQLSKRMEELIDSLLYFSRLGQTELAVGPMDLEHVVKDVLNTLDIRLKECGVTVKIPRQLPTVTCDKARIGEIFRNLITNSMKYNDKAEKWIEIGYIHVSEHDTDEHDPSVFYVRDNGIGIREKHLGSVFRIFKRLHGRDKFGGGTGVGLTMTKKMIERHGGHMWVESIYGEGTTFYFTLQKTLVASSDSEPRHTIAELVKGENG